MPHSRSTIIKDAAFSQSLFDPVRRFFSLLAKRQLEKDFGQKFAAPRRPCLTEPRADDKTECCCADMSLIQLPRKKDKTAYFTRAELSVILAAYSARVASAEWRDYALDHLPGAALFSIFRHAHETPLLVIEKRRGKGKRGPLFLLHDRKRVLTRSSQLSELVSYLHRMPRLVHS